MSGSRSNPTLDAALDAARAGLRVFPLRPGKKEPAIKEWQRQATTDETQIQEWFARYPRFNLGAALYPDSPVTVLDPDQHPGQPDGVAAVREIEAAYGLHLLDLPHVKTPTGEGRHVYGLPPEELNGTPLDAPAPSVDVFGRGTKHAVHYVVLPPSKTPPGAYTIVGADSIEDLVEGARPFPAQLWNGRPRTKAPTPRHRQLLDQAVTAGRRGETEGEILTGLRARRAREGWEDKPDDELQRLAAWAAENVDGDELPTDLGNARLIARLAGGRLRHTPEWGWCVYDGKRWKANADGEAVQVAKATLSALYDRAKGQDHEHAKSAVTWALKSQSARGLRDALSLAETEPGIHTRADVFDADSWLLNVQNGTLDLRTGDLRSHRPEDGITKIAAVEYDPEAPAPRWRAFLEEVIPDPEIRACVQRWYGYCCTAVTTEQTFAFLYGAGANGKTTLQETALAAMGEYAQTAAFDTLLRRKAGAATNDLARLPGARIVSASEPNENVRLDEALVKLLTGGDRVTARFLYRELFEFKPTFKLSLFGNHRPRIVGTDHGIWRRVALIPFDVEIPEERQDKSLGERLLAELPGVLAWMVEGCRLWKREGLSPPPAVKAATEDYRRDEDRFGAFLDERCEVADGLEVSAKSFRAAYLAWCEGEGDKPISQRAAWPHLSKRGIQKDHREQGTTYLRVRVLSEGS